MKKLTTQKTIWQDDYCEVVINTFTDENNKISQRAQIKERPFVAIVAIADGRVLISREWRTERQEEVWGVPTGYIEKEETPEQAARRELLEETGYRADSFELLYQFRGTSKFVQSGWAFLARDPVLADKNSEIKFEWIDDATARKLALQNKLGDRLGLAVLAGLDKIEEK